MPVIRLAPSGLVTACVTPAPTNQPTNEEKSIRPDEEKVSWTGARTAEKGRCDVQVTDDDAVRGKHRRRIDRHAILRRPLLLARRSHPHRFGRIVPEETGRASDWNVSAAERTESMSESPSCESLSISPGMTMPSNVQAVRHRRIEKWKIPTTYRH
jgi:hypothetical protein